MSGGHSKTKTQTRELNAAERADIFNSQLGLFSSALNGYTPQQGGGYAGTGPVSWGSPDMSDSFSAGNPWSDNPENLGTPAEARFGAAAERALFGKAVSPGDGMGNANPYKSAVGFNAPQYSGPGYAEAGAPRTLSGGDYDRLEELLAVPLKSYEKDERERVDQDAADRGIWSSGLASQGQLDVTEALAPAYAGIGTKRYDMQSAENQMINELLAQDAAQRNTFNLEQAARNYESAWAPLRYLQELYGQTGGSLSATNQYDQKMGF
jgi:hypothetical protein